MSSSANRKQVQINKNPSSSKPIPDALYKSLRIDNYLYYYKDTTSSEKTSIKFQFSCIKKCRVYLHIHRDYLFPKYCGYDSSDKPIICTFSNSSKRDTSLYLDFTREKIFCFGEHKQECRITNFHVQIGENASTISKNFEFLRKEVIKDPLKSSAYFKDLMVNQNQNFSITQIKAQLRAVREELFPKDVELIFNSDKIWIR